MTEVGGCDLLFGVVMARWLRVIANRRSLLRRRRAAGLGRRGVSQFSISNSQFLKFALRINPSRNPDLEVHPLLSTNAARCMLVASGLLLSIVATGVLADTIKPDAGGVSRRRAVRPGPPAVNTGDCATFSPIRVGLKAGYSVTSAAGNSTFTVTFVSDSATQTRTTQTVSTPASTSTVETTLDYENVAGISITLRATKHTNVKTTTTTPFVPIAISAEVDVTFVPSLVLGPAAGWCAGVKWAIPATTETIVSTSSAGTATSVVTTVQGEGEVLAVNEQITTAAGTFSTVKSRSVLVSGSSVSPAISWNSIQNGITVRQQTLDANGAVTSTVELTSIQ